MSVENSSQGKIVDSEGREIVPALSIRPHHLFIREVVNSLSGVNLPDTSKNETHPSYIKDIMGTTVEEANQRSEECWFFIFMLAALPKGSFIHIDLERDGFCEASRFGRHCTATNYSLDRPPRDVLTIEQSIVNELEQRLKERGHEEGTDYVSVPTKHVFYDFNG